MHVSRIVKKGKSDVIVFFDDDSKIILSIGVFLSSGLKKNDEVSDDRFSLLIEENKRYHIKQRALRLLGRRQHSESELKRKLSELTFAKNYGALGKNFDNMLIDEVIIELKKSNFLNDKEFADSFVEEKLKTKKWSQRRLQSELIKKGIKQDIISKVIAQKISGAVNYDNAFAVAIKKHESLKKRNLDRNEIKYKLSAFLLSRGFDYETIKGVCEKIIN
jgi:regulatory protein